MAAPSAVVGITRKRELPATAKAGAAKGAAIGAAIAGDPKRLVALRFRYRHIDWFREKAGSERRAIHIEQLTLMWVGGPGMLLVWCNSI